MKTIIIQNQDRLFPSGNKIIFFFFFFFFFHCEILKKGVYIVGWTVIITRNEANFKNKLPIRFKSYKN